MTKQLQKTPISDRFRAALIQANDITCFQAFIHDGFENVSTRAFRENEATFASAAFPGNSYAARVNFTSEVLALLGERSRSWGLAYGLMSSIEHVLSYCDEARDLVCRYRKVQPKSKNDLGPEEVLRSLFVSSELTDDVRGVFRTVTYFRHVRNHIAHARTEVASAMNLFNRQNADNLTKFWSKKPAKLLGFNFESFCVNSATFEEVLGSINIIRISLSELDRYIASSIPISDVVRDERDEALAINPSLKGSEKLICRKVQKRVEIGYGLKLSLSEVSSHLVG